MRGSHNGPLMPCHMEASQPARFDGPPRPSWLGREDIRAITKPRELREILSGHAGRPCGRHRPGPTTPADGAEP